MKRKITFLIAALCAVMMILSPIISIGQSKTDPTYTIGLKGANNTNEITSFSTLSNVLTSGTDQVQSINNTSKVYNNNGTDNGWKLGSTSAKGNFTVNLKDAVQSYVVSKITINAKQYNSSEKTLKITITKTDDSTQESTFSSLTSSFADYDIDITSTKTIKAITVETTSSSKRGCIKSITVTYTSDPTITIGAPNGGTISVTKTSDGSTISTGTLAAGTGITLNATPSTGYAFYTWNVTKTSDGTAVSLNSAATTASNSFSMPSYNTTVNATFTKNNYNVTLGTPENVNLSATDLEEITITEGNYAPVPYGTVLYLSAADMGSGKMFAWSVTKTVGGDDVTATVLSSITAIDAFLTVPDYPVTVSGTVEDIKYYVTYNANGGTGTLVDPDSPYTPGEDVTVLANTFTYSGHVFTNWNTKAGGGGLDYDAGEEISDIAADVTLYAQWADAWTVTLNSNAVETITEVEKEQSISLTAPANVPSGYTYKGWTATPSNPANMVSTTYKPTANVTLYAVFAKTVQEYGETVFVLDGSNFNNGNFPHDSGTKSQALGGSASNNFSSNAAIFVTKNGGYIYNSNAFGSEITKFEIYANQGGSSTATAGIYFSSTAFSTNPTGAYTWTSLSTGIGADAVIDVSSSIPDNTKYFYFVSTKSDKNAQVQLRITYLAPVYYTRIYPSGPVTPEDDLEIITPTVISDGTILNMGTHELSLGVGGSLTIEDGGQLICSNSVAATIKKNITASTAKSGEGWYTISSPVHDGTDATLDVAHVTNLVSSTADGFKYDMFSYDENTHTWLNQKVSTTPGYESAGFTTMTKGLGYLYRSTGEPLSFIGNTNSGAVDCPLIWSSSEAYLKGFNLIGNPYPHSIAKGEDKAIDNTNLAAGYYVMSNAGGWTACNDGDEIEAKQGILVKTSAAVAGFKIQDVNYVAPSSKANNDNIKFVVANSQYEDIAYARFDKGIGLNKINHRNADIPMLYINQNDEDYAIAMMSDDTKAFNLNFKAMTTSQYTLSLKSKGSYSYLHLIDRLTGKDIDLLLDNEYTFIGSPKDADNRFLIKLSYEGGNNNTNDEIFAYQSGSDIIVNGEGELQVFDVTGRKVATHHVNGVETINVQLQGVYIFRLNEKVQKIVVR